VPPAEQAGVVPGLLIRYPAVGTGRALPPEPPPREFVDADYATTRWGGLVAPREFNPFAWMVAERAGPDVQVARDDPDLTEIVLDIEGPYLKFQLNGDCALSTGCRCDLARRQ
jgi:hypothetical protein